MDLSEDKWRSVCGPAYDTKELSPDAEFRAYCTRMNKVRERYIYQLPTYDSKYTKAVTELERKQYEEILKYRAEYKVQEDAECRAREEATRPRCPTCTSTDIRRISGLSKAVSVGLVGIFSQKVRRQFHCNHCGYEW